MVWAIALFTVPRPYHASVKSHLASDWLQVRRGSSAAETELAVAYSRCGLALLASLETLASL